MHQHHHNGTAGGKHCCEKCQLLTGQVERDPVACFTGGCAPVETRGLGTAEQEHAHAGDSKCSTHVTLTRLLHNVCAMLVVVLMQESMLITTLNDTGAENPLKAPPQDINKRT